MPKNENDVRLALASRRKATASSETSGVHPADLALAAADAVTPQPAGKGASVREVARLANVSVATVSLVINDNPRISAATRSRVRRAMDKLGYRPNRLAQNLSRRDTRMLAVILPPLAHAFADRYFGELVSGISDRARQLKYKVMLEQATPEFIGDRGHLELFESRFVDGALCLGNGDGHAFLADFPAGRHPMVVVNNYFPQWSGLDYVVCDYRGGAEQAMSYLLQLGHRRIGLIAGSSRVQTARDVVETYGRMLRGAGVEAEPTWCEDGLFTELGGAEAAERLLRRHPELTALLAGNDKMAIGAMHFLADAGRAVPQQVSVVGFDDVEHAAFVRPGLTTVHLPLYELGVLACDELVGRIQGREGPVKTVLPTHLVVRNSSGMVRA